MHAVCYATFTVFLSFSVNLFLFFYRTSTVMVADEGSSAVFLTVSRSNGLESAVSVEWEVQSGTAVASGETS